MRRYYSVHVETRAQGAIGSFEPKVYRVEAVSRECAMREGSRRARAAGYETRGVSAYLERDDDGK